MSMIVCRNGDVVEKIVSEYGMPICFLINDRKVTQEEAMARLEQEKGCDVVSTDVSALDVARRLWDARHTYHAYGEITIELPDGLHVDLCAEDVIALQQRIVELEREVSARLPWWRRIVM